MILKLFQLFYLESGIFVHRGAILPQGSVDAIMYKLVTKGDVKTKAKSHKVMTISLQIIQTFYIE